MLSVSQRRIAMQSFMTQNHLVPEIMSVDADADVEEDAEGSWIVLPLLHRGELMIQDLHTVSVL